MIKQLSKIIFSICIFTASFCSFPMNEPIKKLQSRLNPLFFPQKFNYVNYRQKQVSISKHFSLDSSKMLTKEINTCQNLSAEKEEDIPSFLLNPEVVTHKNVQQNPENTPKEGVASRIKSFLTTPEPIISLSSYECSGKEIKISDQSCIKQLSVANQFDTHGGGNASCGYQSLKNSILLIKALQEMPTIEDLSTSLKDLNFINQLFGPLHSSSIGKWRAIIMQQRATLVFKNYIVQHIGLKKNEAIQEKNGIIIQATGEKYLLNKNKIREIYDSFLSYFAKDAATALTQGNTTSLYIAPDLIIEYIQNQLQPALITDPNDFFDKNASPNECSHFLEAEDYDHVIDVLYNYLHHKDIITNYLDINSLKPFELTLEDTKKVFDFYNKNNRNPSNMDGDWLQEEEIYQLLKFEKQPVAHHINEDQTGLLHTCHFKLTVIEDTHDLDRSFSGGNINQAVFQELLLKSQKGLHKAKTALTSSEIKNYIHAFIVSTAEREGASRGHWFVVLLYKHENYHEYILMDSAYNTNRLYDERVKKIIALLEDQDTTSLVASDEELNEFEKNISSMIDKGDINVLEVITNYQSCGGKKNFSKEVASLF